MSDRGTRTTLSLLRLDDEVRVDVVDLFGLDEADDLQVVAAAAVQDVAGVPVRLARREAAEVVAVFAEQPERVRHLASVAARALRVSAGIDPELATV